MAFAISSGELSVSGNETAATLATFLNANTAYGSGVTYGSGAKLTRLSIVGTVSLANGAVLDLSYADVRITGNGRLTSPGYGGGTGRAVCKDTVVHCDALTGNNFFPIMAGENLTAIADGGSMFGFGFNRAENPGINGVRLVIPVTTGIVDTAIASQVSNLVLESQSNSGSYPIPTGDVNGLTLKGTNTGLAFYWQTATYFLKNVNVSRSSLPLYYRRSPYVAVYNLIDSTTGQRTYSASYVNDASNADGNGQVCVVSRFAPLMRPNPAYAVYRVSDGSQVLGGTGTAAGAPSGVSLTWGTRSITETGTAYVIKGRTTGAGANESTVIEANFRVVIRAWGYDEIDTTDSFYADFAGNAQTPADGYITGTQAEAAAIAGIAVTFSGGNVTISISGAVSPQQIYNYCKWKLIGSSMANFLSGRGSELNLNSNVTVNLTSTGSIVSGGNFTSIRSGGAVNLNGRTSAVPIIDINANSYLRFDSIDSWTVYSDANRTNQLGSGTSASSFKFNYASGTTYYLTVISGVTSFSMTSTPTAAGETVVTLSTQALLTTLQASIKIVNNGVKKASLLIPHTQDIA